MEERFFKYCLDKWWQYNTYYVHNYSEGSSDELKNSSAKIDVYFGNRSRTFYVPNEKGLYWKVFELKNGKIIPCTSNCVGSKERIMTRSLNNEFTLFKNLPKK